MCRGCNACCIREQLRQNLPSPFTLAIPTHPISPGPTVRVEGKPCPSLLAPSPCLLHRRLRARGTQINRQGSFLQGLSRALGARHRKELDGHRCRGNQGAQGDTGQVGKREEWGQDLSTRNRVENRTQRRAA